VSSDLWSELFEADPHAAYGRLRRECPVLPIELPTGATGWLVTRYDDVRQALTNPRLSKGGMLSPVGYRGVLPEPVQNALAQHVLTRDPPDHTRLRRLVSAGFTARRTEALRPRVQQITDELLDGVDGRDRVDLIDALAFPLPMQVICELIGVPAADRNSFRHWSNIAVSGNVANADVPAAFVALLGYVRELIAAKRADPGDDLLSALIAVSDEGDKLTGDELTSTVFLLLIAGHETTVNLIGNGTYLLLTQREQWDRLLAEPELLPGAVEEFLRYESPVQVTTHRMATAGVELGGRVIPAGATVVVSLRSANRDEARFADPDRLDITRRDSTHLAFGHGIHYCLGAPLARLEGQVAIGSLLRRYPKMRLADEGAAWRPGILMHGLSALPVHL
jgi:cytochrome P450